MQLASRNPLLRTGCYPLGIFFCKAYWATPFQMRFDFRTLLRRTFAKLSRKYPNPQTPAISRGRIRGKANTRGLGVWLSQSLTFGSLAAAFGACFLRLQKAPLGSMSGRYLAVAKPHLQGKVNVVYHSPAGPRAPGRPLKSCNVYNDNDS